MDLSDYVSQLPAVKIEKLYERPFTCLAIFRSLPSIERQYIYRSLFVEGSGIPSTFIPCNYKIEAKRNYMNSPLGPSGIL
jgi:transcription initiation factor TFIIH subunit 4